ncbi:hypothetical protein L218DRAFT_617357 [Marasmius fiardii PR-910]|nr:hypothetical protein L218DRAFT_617357 [Marasmius fiardii PR-910]
MPMNSSRHANSGAGLKLNGGSSYTPTSSVYDESFLSLRVSDATYGGHGDEMSFSDSVHLSLTSQFFAVPPLTYRPVLDVSPFQLCGLMRVVMFTVLVNLWNQLKRVRKEIAA